MGELGGGMYLALVLFLIFLAILWVCLPFAVFGTKPKLDEVITELRMLNKKLAEATALMQQRPPK